MYIYTYINTYTFVHIDTYIYTCIHIHIQIQKCLCTYVHIYTHLYTHLCVYISHFIYMHFVVQLFSHVLLFVTPWTAACHASLSITSCWILLKLMSTELVMSSNHLILCHPLLLLPSIFPSIRVFSNKLTLLIRWSMYWSFSFSIYKYKYK